MQIHIFIQLCGWKIYFSGMSGSNLHNSAFLGEEEIHINKEASDVEPMIVPN